jgi:hypothetical protein
MGFKRKHEVRWVMDQTRNTRFKEGSSHCLALRVQQAAMAGMW